MANGARRAWHFGFGTNFVKSPSTLANFADVRGWKDA
jgi:hypothetical protein